MTWKSDYARTLIDSHVDRTFIVDTLSELARVPTDVPLGYETLMEPDDPKLVHYVQDEIRPRLLDLGVEDLIDDAGNNLIARLGPAQSSRSILLQTYTPAQHHNLMDEPFSGRVGDGTEVGRQGLVVHGQGVSQAKAHQVVMLAVCKLLADTGVQLQGNAFWAVNNEGRSSHACSDAIVAALPTRPDFAILLTDCGMRLSLGNKGRVDIDVTIEGKAVHSSSPQLGLSAIEAASDFVQSLRELSWPDSHPVLGNRHAVVYKVRFDPLAPHTLPSRAELTVDRRLLPGDSVEQAVEEIRALTPRLDPFDVTVKPSVVMFPAMVSSDSEVVTALQRSITAVRDRPATEFYGKGTFDAGGPAAHGIPTIMWGAGGFGDWPLGRDFVEVDDVVDEVRTIAHLLLMELG
ncbi:M20 family metallopeptidase [Nocardia sp. NPDC059246]|uniref:M20 family metallopeptidase n=1 Tax=unclassified Nocardia TaxID=2637762 RepID=UPI0036CF8618